MVRKEEFHQIWEKFDRKFLHELWTMDLQELVEHHVEVQNSYHDLQQAVSRADRYMGDGERITIAFDINSEEFFKADVIEQSQKHYVSI